MGAVAAYMMEEMKIRLKSAQLKAETGAELGNIIQSGCTQHQQRTGLFI